MQSIKSEEFDFDATDLQVLLGKKTEYDDEKPIHEVSIDAFRMGQFPVTHGEYALFMVAGGYENEQWWETEASKAWLRGEGSSQGQVKQWLDNWDVLRADQDLPRRLFAEHRITSEQRNRYEEIAALEREELLAQLEEAFPKGIRYTQPEQWTDPAFNNPNQPVVGVCWFEALAYCAWLSAQSGQTFRLPTEAEWEIVARGHAGRFYAYGATFEVTLGNTFESHIRRTTPVGVFPGGETPDTGLCDISGNVYEWTSSAYESYPYRVGDGREDMNRIQARRVVRGGSWFRNRNSARATARLCAFPDFRGYRLGFRVVCASQANL